MNTQPPPYPQAPVAAAPVPKRNWSAIVLVGLVMLIAGGAAGWFLQPQFADDDTETVETAVADDAAATTAAPATTAAAPTTAAPAPFPSGTWNITGTIGECEMNGGVCEPPTAGPVTWACDATTCTSDSGRVYTLNGPTITWSGPIPDDPITCDGNPVPTTREITYTYNSDGTITGTNKFTAPAAPPSCPNPFVIESLLTGTPA